jgi:hypothetical protein
MKIIKDAFIDSKLSMVEILTRNHVYQTKTQAKNALIEKRISINGVKCNSTLKLNPKLISINGLIIKNDNEAVLRVMPLLKYK